MRLLFLADDFPPTVGGIQTLAAALPGALAALGHHVVVVARDRSGAARVDAGVSFPVLRRRAGSKAGVIFSFRRGCRQVAPRLGSAADWVVATKWFPEGPAALLAAGDTPVALIAHGREFLPAASHWLKRPVQRWVLGRIACALANSQYTAANLLAAGVPRPRTSVIYCGVEPARYGVGRASVERLRDELGLRGKRVLLTAGRLVERKGHDVVVRALPQVIAEIPDVHYVILGDGPQSPCLRAMAAGLGLADRVTFRGRVPDDAMPAHFALCDAFVMPSRDVPGAPIEGFGIVYLEAAAAGKPAIAGRSGGAAEAVLDGQTGLVVDPCAADQVAEAAVRLLRDHELALRLGEAGRERVEREFTWERVAERFVAALSAWGSC